MENGSVLEDKRQSWETSLGQGFPGPRRWVRHPTVPFSFHHTPPFPWVSLPSAATLLCSKGSCSKTSWVSLITVWEKSKSTTASIYWNSSSASYKCKQTKSCRITLHFIVFGRYSTFLQIEGLWQPCVEQIYQHHFSNGIIFFFKYLFVWLCWVLVVACEI